MASILVGYATRTSSARDVATTVADVLREGGHDVRVADLKDAPAVGDEDLVVFGSGIHTGNWYPEAVSWVGRHGEALKRTRVAVYNTCLGVRESREQGLGYNSSMAGRVDAEFSESFAGRYVPAKVGFLRRLFMRTMQKPAQDHFDAEAVRAWARTLIAG